MAVGVVGLVEAVSYDCPSSATVTVGPGPIHDRVQFHSPEIFSPPFGHDAFWPASKRFQTALDSGSPWPGPAGRDANSNRDRHDERCGRRHQRGR